jgi:hypothetical protein
LRTSLTRLLVKDWMMSKYEIELVSKTASGYARTSDKKGGQAFGTSGDGNRSGRYSPTAAYGGDARNRLRQFGQRDGHGQTGIALHRSASSGAIEVRWHPLRPTIKTERATPPIRPSRHMRTGRSSRDCGLPDLRPIGASHMHRLARQIGHHVQKFALRMVRRLADLWNDAPDHGSTRWRRTLSYALPWLPQWSAAPFSLASTMPGQRTIASWSPISPRPQAAAGTITSIARPTASVGF